VVMKDKNFRDWPL